MENIDCQHKSPSRDPQLQKESPENGPLQDEQIAASSNPNKQKKITLGRAILPKNAMIALREIPGISMGKFVVKAKPSGGFSAAVSVNAKQYNGQGASKMMAKINACEKALRDCVLKAMRQKLGEQNTSQDGGNSHTDEMDEDHEVLMINLASFAISKLFEKWKKEGFNVPEMRPIAPGILNDNSKNPAYPTELPPNWTKMHPSFLIGYMRPDVFYTEYGSIGEVPNILHKVGATVDGNELIAFGRSKKSARRAVAVAFCNILFGTGFSEEKDCRANIKNSTCASTENVEDMIQKSHEKDLLIAKLEAEVGAKAETVKKLSRELVNMKITALDLDELLETVQSQKEDIERKNGEIVEMKKALESNQKKVTGTVKVGTQHPVIEEDEDRFLNRERYFEDRRRKRQLQVNGRFKNLETKRDPKLPE